MRGPEHDIDPYFVDEMFRRSAQTHALRPAVILADESGQPAVELSYQELARQVQRAATLIGAHGLKTGQRVCVLARRSLHLPAVILAVLSAGGVYVPIDADYPVARQRFMMQDCAPALLIAVDGAEVPEVSLGDTTILRLGEQEFEALKQTPQREENTKVSRRRSDDASYVIYTSGTTGEPKGAVNTHRGLANHLQWAGRNFGGPGIRMLHKAPVGFDVGLAEVLTPLSQGGAVILPAPTWHPGDVFMTASIIEYCQVTVLSMVPTMMRTFLAALSDAGEGEISSQLASLRHILLGGEAVAVDTVTFALRTSMAKVWGLYGPSETAMDVAEVCFSPELLAELGPGSTTTLLGRAEDNVTLTILAPGNEGNGSGQRWREIAPGDPEPGELAIGGVQVGAGYLNRPDATADAFVPALEPIDEVATMYLTGDIVRWHASGYVEYLGRRGDQVKIRGNRVELPEVDAHISRLDGIDEAAAVAVSRNGEQQLVAFAVPSRASAHAPDEETWLRMLREKLPDYLIPTRLEVISALPLSGNGKLDRAKLREYADSSLRRSML